MESGKLRHRVTLQRVTRTTNVMNEKEESWSSLGTPRRSAEVVGRGGRETRVANQQTPNADYVVKMRADSVTRDLTEDDRIVWHATPDRDITLGIVYVDLSMVHRGELTCHCEAAT